MRFFLDQDVYALTARFLVAQGHDIQTAADAGLSTAEDSVLLQYAQDHQRLFITRDRDFGGLVFTCGAGPGILYLRVTPSTFDSVHHQLGLVLNHYSESGLKKAFVVVEPGRYRFRHIEP